MDDNKRGNLSIKSVIEIVGLLSPEQQSILHELLTEKLGKQRMKYGSSDAVPVSIFSSKNISALESISKYLIEEVHMEFKEIGMMMNRNEVTIRTSYKRANQKHPRRLDLSNYSMLIPLKLFTNRKRSVLGIIVSYLHDHYGVSFKEIARLLARNYKTVWTVYSKDHK